MQTVETLNEGLKRAYRITISAKEIDARVDKELKTIAPQVRMPGFRPGKVPANLMRKMHGPRWSSEALKSAVQDGVQKLLGEQKIRPAMQPQVALEEGGAGQGCDGHRRGRGSARRARSRRSTGSKIERLTVEAGRRGDRRGGEAPRRGQKSFDDAPPSTRPRMGDLVVMDFEGKVDGEPFDGGKGEGMSVELGSGRLIPGFEDDIIGAKAATAATSK